MNLTKPLQSGHLSKVDKISGPVSVRFGEVPLYFLLQGSYRLCTCGKNACCTAVKWSITFVSRQLLFAPLSRESGDF